MSKPNLNLDPETAEQVANALWAEDIRAAQVSPAIARKLNGQPNSPKQFGIRMRHHLDWLMTHPQSFNRSYRKRYDALREQSGALTAHQAYVMVSRFLGADAVQGYDYIPQNPDLQFPRDHAPKVHSQVGWHFFVGSAWDSSGKEYGIECMFFRVALLPPVLAKQHGLTDVENQVVELQLGISEAGGRHYQAEPVVIAGTTGLLKIGLDPLHYQIGRNRIRSGKKESFFPIRLEARGFEKADEVTALGIDLTFTSGKEYLYQGDMGASPSVDGIGTLYYSIPELKLKPGSTVTIDGKAVKLKRGRFWFDHQWGFLGGNPKSPVMRAANNLGAPSPGGWDWFMAQFTGNRELTMASMHDHANVKKYYFQTGAQPPADMVVPLTGKLMDAKRQLTDVTGTLTVDRWVKSERSPNPERYPASSTWYPNRWTFAFDRKVPADIRRFTMVPIVESGQQNFFANGTQYAEGAVKLMSPSGKDLGRGFAESVMYADPTETAMALAGLDPKVRKIVTANRVPALLRLKSLLYMLTHQKELGDILSKARGMQIIGAKSHGQKH